MTFGAPAYLVLLVMAPLAALCLGALAAWRTNARRRFGAQRADGSLRWLAPALLVAAITTAAFAAARPQFGNNDVRVEDRGINLVIVLDVSNSMDAPDTEPTRLGRAQAEIATLLDRLQGDRVGLVMFARMPFVRSPMTADLAALRRIVEGVHEERGLVPAGSDLGAAIRAATELLQTGEADTKAMLIISDGEDHGDTITPAITEAARAGVRIYTGGVGTTRGAQVVDLDPETGEAVPRVGNDGEPVVTRLDAAQLQTLASAGDGRYIELAGDGRPLSGLAAELEGLEATTFGSDDSAAPIERFQIGAAVALALAVAATLAAVGWRLPALGVGGPTLRRAARLWPLGAAGIFFAGVCGTSVAELNRRGNERFDAAQYTESLDPYRTAQSLDGARGELYYNAANALHMLDEYASAIEEAKRALPARDDGFESDVEYGLGSHYAAAARLKDSLEAFKRALLAQPGDEDAKHNLEIISQRLRATPSPVATPTPGSPEGVPTPDTGTPDDPSNGSEQGTPGAGEDSGEPTEGGDLSPEQLQAALERALAGIDEQFTLEEALRVLELLEQQNRGQLGEPRDGAGSGGLPDY